MRREGGRLRHRPALLLAGLVAFHERWLFRNSATCLVYLRCSWPFCNVSCETLPSGGKGAHEASGEKQRIHETQRNSEKVVGTATA